MIFFSGRFFQWPPDVTRRQKLGDLGRIVAAVHKEREESYGPD